MASLEGKVALVTGGTGGIGLCVCHSLAKLGASIVVVDLDLARCQDVAESLPTKSAGVAINIADDAAVKSGIAEVVETFPEGVDILVNIAGILSNNKTEATTAAEWRKVMGVNVDGAFFMTQACVPFMLKKKWGRIINMSSWAWKSGGLTAGTAYSTSKAAITGLTFSTAREYAGDGITANGIAPCYVMSKMVSEQLSEEQRTELLAKIPVKRFCQPEEVAHCVDFLASPLSGFITGEIVDMNGGFQMD